MLRRLAVLAILLLAACAKPPITDEVTVQFFEDHDDVVITADTRFDLASKNPRVAAAQNAAVAGVDPWSVRFTRLSPELDRITFERERGELGRVTHMVRIPADDLPRVFSDTSITVSLIHGDGWQELSLYPGTSSRATREQQRHFEEQLESWSREVARYFTAIDHVYDYLDDKPYRADEVFAALVAAEEDDPPISEGEEVFVNAVIEAMERIATRMDEQEGAAVSFAEEADLIYNPFPARMIIRVPREKDLVIEPVDLFAAIAALEGKWISPDPLAALLKNEIPTAEQLAEMPRKSTSKSDATEIASAIREQLARPKTYTLRWRN